MNFGAVKVYMKAESTKLEKTNSKFNLKLSEIFIYGFHRFTYIVRD